MSDPTAVPLDAHFDQGPGSLVQMSPLVRRIVAPNPGPMTFHGTCTYVVGRGEVVVIDPGPELTSHINAIVECLSGERVTEILVTHTHRDHSPGARLLQTRTDAPIVGCKPYVSARPPHETERAAVAASNDLDYAPDRVLYDGDTIEGAGFELQAVETPGHTMNHLAFALPQEKALFSGDHVMAWATTIVSPPTGSMTAYMASLEKLRARDETVYWPGHGGPVRDPKRFLRALQHHRRQRELAILGRLGRGDETIEAIVSAIYEQLDPRLRRAAGLSVLAHLEDLVGRGRVRVDGEDGHIARYAPASSGCA